MEILLPIGCAQPGQGVVGRDLVFMRRFFMRIKTHSHAVIRRVLVQVCANITYSKMDRRFSISRQLPAEPLWRAKRVALCLPLVEKKSFVRLECAVSFASSDLSRAVLLKQWMYLIQVAQQLHRQALWALRCQALVSQMPCGCMHRKESPI